MPRSNQFFDNLSETPILSEREAFDVLEEYCDENNISLYELPSSSIDNFIQTVRYAPSEIETEEIARRVGIQAIPTPSRPSRPSPSHYPYFTYSNISNDTIEPQRQQGRRIAQVTASNGIGVPQQGTGRSINFSELLQESVLTAQVPSDTISSVEDMTAPIREEGDDIYESLMADLSWTTRSSTPKKKKRKRSEVDMMAEIVRGENFPRPNFKDWSNSRDLDRVINDWYGNVEYREQWIFSRREREGFNRRNVGSFSLDDVMARMSKRKKQHDLDTETSKFYDWKLGGTDWYLRLELYQHEQTYFLITRHIHKPTESEIKFDVRYWTGDRFKIINMVWNQKNNNDIAFDRVFGSNDESNPYYAQPYDEDNNEDEDYYDEDCDSDCEEEYEDSPF